LPGGFTATTSVNPFQDNTAWTIYVTFFGGNFLSNRQSVTEYEGGIFRPAGLIPHRGGE